MDAEDPFDLDRFVAAQADSWAQALAELNAGLKRSHWMWYIFPQIAGLGRSDTARRYAIRSMDEARAYLAHPLLGPRLADATAALLRHPARTAEQMLGAVDAIKLRSSLTLFVAAGAGSPLDIALWTFFADERDAETMRLLGRAG
ncbi:DUF1810 domain-containing protein [Sphingomonas bacterium]|uniref:DUF1810 domain-containing protein n=1 Tax=Sphingomonas bacterium TaxID=1895847 RepID=UPI001576E848|nr:DUF1810 domain-containing protein [Sphingomonas bacterium]